MKADLLSRKRGNHLTIPVPRKLCCFQRSPGSIRLAFLGINRLRDILALISMSLLILSLALRAVTFTVNAVLLDLVAEDAFGRIEQLGGTFTISASRLQSILN